MNRSTRAADAAAPSPAAQAVFLKTTDGNRLTITRATDAAGTSAVRIYVGAKDFAWGLSFTLDPMTAAAASGAIRLQAERLITEEARLFDGGAA
jgi:hypothetical protein